MLNKSLREKRSPHDDFMHLFVKQDILKMCLLAYSSFMWHIRNTSPCVLAVTLEIMA